MRSTRRRRHIKKGTPIEAKSRWRLYPLQWLAWCLCRVRSPRGALKVKSLNPLRDVGVVLASRPSLGHKTTATQLSNMRSCYGLAPSSAPASVQSPQATRTHPTRGPNANGRETTSTKEASLYSTICIKSPGFTISGNISCLGVGIKIPDSNVNLTPIQQDPIHHLYSDIR